MSKLTLLQLHALWHINKKPTYGYDLITKLNENKRITQGTIYPLLKSFKKEGLVKSKCCGKRGKKTYYITKKGKRVLECSCKSLCELYKEIFKKYVCEVCGR